MSNVEPQQEKVVDVYVENQGTIFRFSVETDAARAWVDEHVQLEDWQWLGNSFGVDHRMARDLAQGMLDAGLVLE